MLAGHAAKGHRYSEQYKMFALTLYHASQKCYKMLRKVFALPGVSTLKALMKRVDINPGFHAAVLEGLRMKTTSMSPSSKLCAIVFVKTPRDRHYPMKYMTKCHHYAC